MKEWCKDIADLGVCYTMADIGVQVNNFNYCPICGTPRPQEPKKLWEKIDEARDEHSNTYDLKMECLRNVSSTILSDLAKSHIIEVVRRTTIGYGYSSSSAFSGFVRGLIKAIDEC